MVAAAGIVVVLVVAFAIVPNLLAQVIERRSRSLFVRDLALSAWFVASLGGASWGLVWLQRRRII